MKYKRKERTITSIHAHGESRGTRTVKFADGTVAEKVPIKRLLNLLIEKRGS